MNYTNNKTPNKINLKNRRSKIAILFSALGIALPISLFATSCAATTYPYGITGSEYTIKYDNQKAVIVSRGGGIKEYKVGNKDITVPYKDGVVPSQFENQMIAPFNNRIPDGEYTWNGNEYYFPINEHSVSPARNNALNGLVWAMDWQLKEISWNSVTLAIDFPHDGVILKSYPFKISVELTYLLGSDGLTLNWKIKNNGTTTAPFACGMHPYFSLGGKAPGNVKLMIDANKHTIVDSSLNLTGDGMDEQNLFDTPKSLNTTYDDGYIKNYFNGNISSSFLYLDSTNLTHDFIKLSQSVPNGYKVAWQLYSGEAGTDATHLNGVALEPYTAPLDAFNHVTDSTATPNIGNWNNEVTIYSQQTWETVFNIFYQS